METNSHPEAAASTVKQGQYSPRKRKDTAPKVNPQLAIELFFQEMGRIEAYTKRIEDATSGGEITHAVLNGSIVSKPAGWDAFHGLVLAKEKLSSEEIQRQMKELGVEMEIVPLI